MSTSSCPRVHSSYLCTVLGIGSQYWLSSKSTHVQAIRSRDVKGEFDRLNFPTGEDNNDFDLMTLGEIINGKSSEEAGESGDCFPGILPLVHAYLDLIECSGATRDVLNCYLDLVRLRASGELQTAAQWIRGFVTGNTRSHRHLNQYTSIPTPVASHFTISTCVCAL